MEISLVKESALVEAVLFMESEPLTEKTIANISQLSEDVVKGCIEKLKEKYKDESFGFELTMITGGWALTPKQDIWEQLKERYGSKSEGRLSRSALETLTIIAYKQPITRTDVEHIRGVSVDNMMRLLIERNLIKEVGKKDTAGKPTLYGTTKEFLKFFKLNSISELPQLDEEDERKFVLAR